MSALLVLGGTGEARELASLLDADGVPLVSSLAGRVSAPRRPVGEVRMGGFGGPEGLERWLVERGAFGVVDATHPFAARISASAAAACRRARVPLLRIERPPWREGSGDRWHRVPDVAGAAEAVGRLGARALLALGRQEVAPFLAADSIWFLIRSVSPPAPPLPARHELLLDRGPFTLDGELALIDRHRIDVVVTRDSGGEATSAKLAAARERHLPVVVVSRPPSPSAETVATVAQAAAWALALAGAAATMPASGRHRLGD